MTNLFNLENKIAIVTGGGSGLGRGMAKAFAQAGANVVIADINIENAQKTSDEIIKLRKQSFSIGADVTNKKDMQNMVEKTVHEFGKIDILVNAAGTVPPPIPLIEMDEENWDRVIDVNLKGTFLSNKAVSKQMIKQKSGRIINIASMSGSIVNHGQTGIGVYCASKAGVILFTKALAMELIRYNINVNSISPGYMKTPLTIPMWDRDPAAHKASMDMTPIGRPGTSDELNGLAVYLASDSSSFMTGSDILIDGGFTCW